jgi:hypothetical protein
MWPYVIGFLVGVVVTLVVLGVSFVMMIADWFKSS